ncbi:MAG TPA: type II secretion system protein [Candidatus Saccharimonadales bacterium]
MLQKLQKRKETGFTIIEVLIVLAIAGLIMLVVFLAVPALRRSSRNTTRKADVSAALGAVSEFVNNNSGTLPDTAAVAGKVLTISLAAGGANNSTANMGYYTTNSATAGITMSTQAAYGATNNTTTDTVVILTGASCNGNNPAAGSSRGIVAVYTLENNSKQCQES